MKTTTSIMLLALTLAVGASANIINVVHQSANSLEFYSGDTTPGQEDYFYVSGSGQGQSLVDITAEPVSNDVVYSVYWATSTYQVNDSFTLTENGPVGFEGSHSEFRPLTGRWHFTYTNPNPVSNQVPDSGSTMFAAGIGLAGLLRFRRN